MALALRLPRRGAPEPAQRSDVAPVTLLVRPELMRTISAAAAHAGWNETGGPLFGTVHRSWDGRRLAPIACVLGTVSPGPAVAGRLSSVSLGRDADGDQAAAAIRWLRSATGLELMHLGDWHVHPSGVCRPSRGDLETAQVMRAQSAAPVWLVAVAASRQGSSESLAARGGAALYSRKSLETAEVRFHHALERTLVPMPARIEGNAIPRLPPLPWYVADPVRFAAECRLLHAAGFRTAVEAAPSGHAGFSLRLQRDGAGPLTVRTGAGYPQEQPKFFDERGRRLPLAGAWSAERFLVDLAREVQE